MSNFDFLKDFDETLWKLGNRIEKQVNISPSGVKADSTTFLEHILKKLLAMAGMKYNSRKNFTDQVDAVFRSELKMSNSYREKIKNAYNYRNKIHDEFEEIEKHEFQDALQLHEKLFYIARKFYRDYNDDYDAYKGVPEYKPLKLDFSDDEVELVRVPDFNHIVDVRYDYCVICGQPNHLNYSIYCHKCSRVIENANTFISIRNAFGKDARFTKEDLMEYGIAEGYANQFINSMVREDMLRVMGRFITFNNMHLDEYLTKIDNYIAVGELITRFREDKITPSEIKKSMEYKRGSFRQEPFYQFFKIINQEIINKFEKDILTTEDIKRSIEYTTITQNELKRWYDIQLAQYKKGNINESFVVFNDLLKENYIELKRTGMSDKEIRKTLNVNDVVYGFWCYYDSEFESEIKQIKIDLLIKAIQDGKTKADIIDAAGVTPKEYDDLVKLSEFKGNEFARLRNQEIETRKKDFVRYLKSNDLKHSCSLAKFSLDDFYDYYEKEYENSYFFKRTTEILMDKYLAQRRLGKTKEDAVEIVGIKKEYLDRWLSRTQYSDFKDDDLKVTVSLILRGLKRKQPLSEIAEIAGVKENAIRTYVKLGGRGSNVYAPLFEYYEAEIVPQKLERFTEIIATKSIRKALDATDLTFEEIDRYYNLGKSGDERFVQFYEDFLDKKKLHYVYYKNNGKSHKIAMRESRLTAEEYEECRDELEGISRKIKFNIVLETIASDKTSNVAASKAGCSVDEIYEWYFRGRDGDEDYRQFYENFHKGYVRPNIEPLQKIMDTEQFKVDNLIRSNKEHFTKRDFEIWMKNGLINVDVIHIESDDDEDEDDEKTRDTVKLKTRVKNPNSKRSSLGRLDSNDYDVEELKRQILRK
ncbi:hypothetical protein [Methanobrevibacter sp.]|uniref:hypothetical protein n=1 Tax=Methanobrevibacter sp. TaxID=66852 RepID=UPI003890FD35